MTYKPFRSPNHKPIYLPRGLYKLGRYKCMDCGAEFWDIRDDDKMFRHSKERKWGHIGWIGVPNKNYYDRSKIKRTTNNWKAQDGA